MRPEDSSVTFVPAQLSISPAAGQMAPLPQAHEVRMTSKKNGPIPLLIVSTAESLLSGCASFAMGHDALVQRTVFAFGLEPALFPPRFIASDSFEKGRHPALPNITSHRRPAVQASLRLSPALSRRSQ